MTRALAPIALALGVIACGAGAPPNLPPEPPSPVTARAVSAPAAPALLGDRGLGRTGFSCADCHRLEAPNATSTTTARAAPRRPGPDLGGVSSRAGLWSGATDEVAVAANLCVERYLARVALDGPTLGGLVAALGALPVPSPAPAPASAEAATAGIMGDPVEAWPEGDPVRGAGLYDAACRHCHEDGPAGALWGRPWARLALIRSIRGLDRPRHPATLMPPFDTRSLPDRDVSDLTTALADAVTPGF